ncbi:hypothetical protein GCM10011415_37060 [Salipiger pallidus]|uniref:D-isomer specific 2-hydroxyacid dehydrogenase NAD-binding domain-containing protein n=1 Tax=Salipiger pallidus TaxID=1775170 RepID=A0A8J3EI46_9RHOB|nr:hypothetical protein GCM10011415_37060 [Salipiger pallidus]
MARALGMQVTAFDSALRAEDLSRDEFELCSSIDALVASSDIIPLHCLRVPSTRQKVDAASLSRMQSHAMLVNTARGEIIDETAPGAAFRQGDSAGASGDSFEVEPPYNGHPLFLASELIVSPHAAGLTSGAERDDNDGSAFLHGHDCWQGCVSGIPSRGQDPRRTDRIGDPHE